jgi:L-asparaginase / beta-aspartyl-peptidase
MPALRPTVVAHAGALADPGHRDGPEAACRAGLAQLAAGGGPLAAAVTAVVVLEEDGRFNAGTGAVPRLDGATVEMDAACADGTGRFGAVAGVRLRNPVLVARAVLGTPHNLLAGAGAMRFAERLGLAAPHEPSPSGPASAARLRADFLAGAPNVSGWTPDAMARLWNYPGQPPGCDTVGAIATDGRAFAAAASTGGLSLSLQGRVSDVALVGCGIHAGAAGAVAATGYGEHLARTLASWQVHDAMAAGATAREAVEAYLATVPEGIPAGLVALGPGGAAAATNCTMPWAVGSL